MLSCITFYLTDTLKRLEKRTLANIFNKIGLKLLGEESSTTDLNIFSDNANKTIVNKTEPATSDQLNESNSRMTKKSEKSSKNVRSWEVRAYEIYNIKENFNSKITASTQFTGNEENSLIFTHIKQNR